MSKDMKTVIIYPAYNSFLIHACVCLIPKIENLESLLLLLLCFNRLSKFLFVDKIFILFYSYFFQIVGHFVTDMSTSDTSPPVDNQFGFKWPTIYTRLAEPHFDWNRFRRSHLQFKLAENLHDSHVYDRCNCSMVTSSNDSSPCLAHAANQFFKRKSMDQYFQYHHVHVCFVENILVKKIVLKDYHQRKILNNFFRQEVYSSRIRHQRQ